MQHLNQEPREPKEWACTDDDPFNNGTYKDESRGLYYPRAEPVKRTDEDDDWDYQDNERFD